MIRISNNNSNDVVLTLSSSLNCTYSLDISNKTTDFELNNILLYDQSTHPDRYNIFQLVLTANPASQSLSESIIFIRNEGLYDYTVSDLSGSLLEQGILYVTGSQTDRPIRPEYNYSSKKPKYVYNKEQ